jgi:hypothetical protein
LPVPATFARPALTAAKIRPAVFHAPHPKLRQRFSAESLRLRIRPGFIVGDPRKIWQTHMYRQLHTPKETGQL